MNKFIATAADVRKLVADIWSATDRATEGRGTYLKLLVGTTQAELHSATPKHAPRGRLPKLSAETIQLQLVALNTVHERFYAAVLEAAQESLPAGGRRGRFNRDERAEELNRRTNFARSSMSRLRAYIRAGNDVTLLVPENVTQQSIAVEGRVRPPSVARTRRAVEARSKALVASVLDLIEVDKVAAREEIELLMGQLANQLAELGGPAVRDLRRAAEMGVPMRTPGGRLFVPVTETQIIRQQARPS